MGLLDRLFGSDQPEEGTPPARRRPPTEDERALERYRYLLRTAPPETIEQVHAEAFAKLTDQQRAQIYEQLSQGAGTGERPLSSEPATLARAAARAEMRDPGTLERSFQGPSFGGMIAGSLLGTLAGYVIGSALVSAFLPWDAGYDANASDQGGDTGDSGDSGSAADPGSTDAADAGGDFGGADAGGDFGGGDFGGDFGF